MLHQLLTPFRGRKHQAYQISRWRRVKLSDLNMEEHLIIRQACDCLFTVTDDVINLLYPRQAGCFFSIVHKCIEALAIWVGCELDDNAVGDGDIFSRQLKDYIDKRFPDAAMCNTATRELVTLVTDALHRARDRNPEYAEIMAQVCQQGWTEDQVDRLFLMHLELVRRINRALFQGLLPKLRIEYSLTEMITFTSAYRRESQDLHDDFPLLRDHPVELEVDETEKEYEVMGDRVELSAFCKLVVLLPPRGTACAICVTDLNGKEDVEGDLPVLTKCKHFFHKDCLDKWVNESAMKTSNTCPTCRTVLCKPRKRLHASLEPIPGAHDEDDASSTTNSTAAMSVVAASSWPRLQRLNTRIANHLSRRGRLDMHYDWSDSDDSSISSSDSDEFMIPRRVNEVIRVERRDQLRIVNV